MCAAIALACGDHPVEPSNTGSIILQIRTTAPTSPAPSAAGRLDTVRIVISIGGMAVKTFDLTPNAGRTAFSGTVDGLRPGSYEVALLGLIDSEVDYFGQTSGVQVRAGRTASATINNWSSFQPVLKDLGPATAATSFTVSWDRVANATSYKVEWGTRDTVVPDRPGTLPMSVTLPAPDTGTYNVQVRSVNASVAAGRASDPKTIRVATPSASRSLVSVAPATIVASAGALTAAITVTVRDANDIPLRGATVKIVVSPDSGNNLIQIAETTGVGGQIAGTLSSTRAEVKTISARINGTVTVGQTAIVTVTPGAATMLVFTKQPSTVPVGRNVFPAGYVIFPEVQVAAQDALGNTDSSYTSPVTLTLGNPRGATLTGATGPQTPIKGLANWASLSINNVATKYTFSASSGTLVATSDSFNVTIAGDLNLDGLVDYADYDTLVKVFGATDRPPADINKDGKVGIFDYNLLATNFSAPPPFWSQLAPTGTPPDARWFHSAVYDPSSNKMIVFGGQGASTSFNDLWLLTNANGSGGTSNWTTMSLTPTPGSRVGHSAVYDPTSNRMVVFGWSDPTLILTNANGVGGTPSWSPGVGGPLPQSRSYHTAVYDPSSSRMVVFGGFNGTTLGDLWVLTNATGTNGTWLPMAPAGTPPEPRLQHTAVYDPNSNRMIVYGGSDSLAATVVYGDVWVLTNANGVEAAPTTWIQLNPTGAPPLARRNHTAVYDPSSNRMVIFGGNNISVELNDVWVLTHANGNGGTPSWCQLSPDGGPPPVRTGHSAIYDSSHSRMVVFAGADSTGLLNDVWVLESALGRPCSPS